MSFSRFGLIVVATFAALALLAASGGLLREAFEAVPSEIARGFFYNDAGGYERTIFFKSDSQNEELIIDARVDDYLVKDGKLLVARRPRSTKLGDDDAVDSSLSPKCEYWVIDLNTREKISVPSLVDVRCF
jgi:hypothetical protein